MNESLRPFSTTTGRITHERTDDSGSEAILGLLPGELLCLFGSFAISVRSGARVLVNDVSVGHGDPPLPVLAPLSSPAVVVRAVPGSPSLGLGGAFSGVCAVVSISRLERRPPGSGLLRVREAGSVLGVDGARIAADGAPFHTIPQQWSLLVDELAAFGGCPSVAVCGAKSTGKSSLCRFLAGALMARCGFSRVAWLDCDVGQPEFTAPGVVSLAILDSPVLAPPFSHVAPGSRTRPALSFFLGESTHQRLPGYYVRCVEMLVEELARIRVEAARTAASAAIPLIVNTSGWVVGSGYDTLVEALRAVSPTHVVQLFAPQLEQQAGAAPVLLHPEDVEAAFEGITERMPAIRSIASIAATLPKPPLTSSAKELRSAQLLSYFGDHITGLASSPSYVVPFSAVTVAFLVEAVPPSQALVALNGTVVGLCACPDASLRQVNTTTDPEAQNLPRFLVGSPRPCPCAGLGIIRSIDVSQRSFHIVCPFDPAAAGVNMIVRAPGLELPPSLTAATFVPALGSIVASPYLAPDSLIQPGSGSTVVQPKTYLQRRGGGAFRQLTFH